MSQTKFLAITADNTTRRASGHNAGNGRSKRYYVGRSGHEGITYDWFGYLKFNLDWAGVGRIIKATLYVYTSDHLGIFAVPTASNPYTLKMRQLTSAFADGNNDDGHFDGTDYTAPSFTTANERTPTITKAEDGLNVIDLTAQMNKWAPKTVMQSTGKAGLAQPNHGIGLFGHKGSALDLWSHQATNPSLRPVIELVYEEGLTRPSVPGNLAPTGTVDTIEVFEGDFTDTRNADRLVSAQVEVYPSSASASGQTVTGTRLWSLKQQQSASAIDAARFEVDAGSWRFVAGQQYKFRARVTDNQGQTSLWSGLTAFTVLNSPPDDPVPSPDGPSFATLTGVHFSGGTFADPDDGDVLGGYQVQLADLPEGDPGWDSPDNLKWDTGRRYVLPPKLGTFGGVVIPRGNPGSWRTTYGGMSLEAGAYKWRARHWDSRGAVSNWVYADITLTADFESEAGQTPIAPYSNRAPWRVVIRGMGANRGPGNVVAILEDEKSLGASMMYNSPGELHFTLGVDHPQISVIEPKQTHYAVEFYQGDGWREVFAGLMWDVDATERDVVFKGIDYPALYDLVLDERFDPANPDKPTTSGGSKYVDKTIKDVVTQHLTWAKGLTNSPVGFIGIGAIATMNEKVTIWSTMQPALTFVSGLIDSHRQGTGKKTRIQVVKTPGGANPYEVRVVDDPGVNRDNLRMRYGELVQGYRIVAFGDAWASRQHGIGRTREGIKVMYKSEDAPGIAQGTYGRIAGANLYDGVSDEADLIRRTKQAALRGGKLGSQIALAIRSGFLRPRSGYDLCDSIPVEVIHGAIDTTRFGSGYWTIFGVAWEAGDQGQQETILTILPREDTTPPDPDLIPSRPISPQAEWQIGWVPPSVPKMLHIAFDTGLEMDADVLLDTARSLNTGRVYYDAATGKVYELADDGVTWNLIVSPPTVLRPVSAIPFTRLTVNNAGVAVANVTLEIEP